MSAEPGSSEHVLSVVVCAAAPTANVSILAREATARGWAVQVICTPPALPFFDADEIAEITGTPVRSENGKPGDPPAATPEAIIVAPATFATMNQWALGISDGYALGVLAEQTGQEIPIVVVPFVSQPLADRPPFGESVKALRAEGVSILLGPGGTQPHPVHTEADHVDDFPWLAALDEVSDMTGFGVPDIE